MPKLRQTIACTVPLCVSLLWSQNPFLDTDKLRLPTAVRLSGSVQDAAGHPIPSALIGNTEKQGPGQPLIQTDNQGQFAVETQAPYVVVRKAGFASQRIAVAENTPIAARLTAADSTHPLCPSRECSKTETQLGNFCVPPVSGVQISEKERDIDYVARTLTVKTATGWQFMLYGRGHMWSFGVPLNYDVWASTAYQEYTQQWGRSVLLDARGELSNGKRWRYVGIYGESVGYSYVDQAAAAQFDRVLDHLCLLPPK